MMGIIFHHGAKENAIFYSKFNVLEFFGIDNLHKKFGTDISKICRFFFYCPTFGGNFSVF